MGKMELAFLVSLIVLLSVELGISDAAATNSSLVCIDSERRALLSFKETLSYSYNPNNVSLLPSWNSNNKDCCSWEAVTCHKITGHVISLDLTRGNTPSYEDILKAETVDSSLLEMKHLTYLDLSSVSFNYNKFPAYLGSLKHLRYLNLSFTHFSGFVPQSLGNLSSLRTLDLRGGYNLRVDGLTWVTGLSSLEHLDMTFVNLSMTTHVFEVLHTIPSLLFLSLSGSGLDNKHLPNSCMNNSTLLAHNLQHLDLSRNSFDGEFSCFLPNMTSLRFLDLSWNMLNYTWISKFLGNSFYLKSLNLNGIGIYGDISGVFKNLSSRNFESLSLGNNRFYGELPQELGKLSALTDLDVSYNSLSGPFPSWLANLTSLSRLDLSSNKLSGYIPISLGQLSNLEYIDISSNRFEITLSEAHFARLSKLEELRASFNNMINFDVGYDWVPPFQIKHLKLGSTKMGGQFPQWLQTQKALSRLDLSNCSITGSLPVWLHSMSSLYTFDVSHNNISGPMPELSSSMWALDFSDNMITHLPSNIGHMIPLVLYLNLAQNFISGSIPDSLCQIKEMRVLDLSKNHLSGNLPNCWPSLRYLTVARLSYNELTGVIPESIGGAHNLWRLWLNDNSLTGQLPSTLQNCKELEFLDVGGNNMSGKLPQWIGKHLLLLKFLRLRNNDFSGTIPRELCRLSQLQVMDLASNNLTGNIPHCFGNFSGMMFGHKNGILEVSYGGDNIMVSGSLSQVMKGVELEYTTNFGYLVNLDLSNNHLVGEIPSELTNLSGLLGLNLSHNHLRGEIPAKIGDMKSLVSLDLSNNNLRGKIPGSVSSLSLLSRLNLSNNNLSGQIPTGRQLQTLEDPSIYEGNPLLCGAPLQRKCVNEEATEVENHESPADRIWFYGIVISGFATGFWAVIGAMVVKTKWRQAYFSYIEVVARKMLGY